MHFYLISSIIHYDIKNLLINFLGVNLKKFYWVIILLILTMQKAFSTSVGYALGFMIPWLIGGMILSPLVWLIARKFESKKWTWSDWLNVGSILTAALIILSAIVRASLG